jgi:nucleoside-diphosphate-sugar epimerase
MSVQLNDLKDRNIVLVGGAGFIGHNLALELKRLGAKVTIVDGLAVNNLYSFQKSQDTIPNAGLYLSIIDERLRLLKEHGIPVIEADSRDYHKLCEVLGQIKPDTLVHLAAVAHANVSNKDPHTTFDHSLRTLENSLDIARSTAHQVKHFIYFSSSMVYGNFVTGVVDETTVCEPLGIYGALKFAGEKMVIAYNQVFGLPYTIIRPSALYGERCVSRRVGQIFIENAMRGLEIAVNGDGSDRVDFTYIGDLVQGIVRTMQCDAAKNQIFNLTYGQSRSLAEMTEIIKKHFPEVGIKLLPKDRLMPDRGTLSVEKAKRMIGYDPQHPLEKGFIHYIEWYRELFKNLKPEVAASLK